MAKGHVNLHRGLQPGELTSRYRRLRDKPKLDDGEDPDRYVDYDDYWDPRDAGGSLDFELHRIWQDTLAIAHTPTLGLDAILGAPGEAGEAGDPDAAAPSAISPDELAEALHQHLTRVTARDTREHALAAARSAVPRDQIRSAWRQEPRFRRWFERHHGPGILLIVLAPFWIRSLGRWSPPADGDDDDDDATTRSLLDHLFGRYPIPPALYRPWLEPALPSLKWASWLVLIGGGASLRRAARRFGWHISPHLLPHLFEAPARLQPIDAIMWAEHAGRGGSPLEHAR